jgi:putative flippase GtrA
MKFYAVGGVGIGVQLAALVVFRSVLHLDYRLATVLSVEIAVLRNFILKT